MANQVTLANREFDAIFKKFTMLFMYIVETMKLKSLGILTLLIFLVSNPYRIIPNSVQEKKSIVKKPVLHLADLKDLEEVKEGYDYQTIINNYQPKLGNEFTVTKFNYFIIFSNMPDNKTYELIDNDIRHTEMAMENNYITVKPQAVTAVFLFDDDDSYKKFALANFKDIEENDLSPYGFYKVSKRVILVRYISWKGSIAHEVTHSMLQDDFPDIPGWFNEGFASLHEKSTFRDGNLIGEFSWRINAIRSAFKDNKYTDLNHLMTLTDNELYSSNSSFYYAQSRFLLGYIQEKGLLKRYYTLFRDTYETDNTGISQLEKLLKMKLSEFEPLYLDYLKSFNK